MKVSISELLLMISQKTKEIRENYFDVINSIYIIKDRELNGTETILNEVSDFDVVIDKYETAIDDLNIYKDALNIANSTIKTKSGMTLYEAMNYINSLRKKVEIYNTLAAKKTKLSREFDGTGSSSYYKVSELNYNADIYKDLKDALNTSISTLEADIANTNATNFIEI